MKDIIERIQVLIAENVNPEILPEFQENVLKLQNSQSDHELIAFVVANSAAAIEDWNKSYREGSPKVDDPIYDAVVEFYEKLTGKETVDTHSEIPDNDARKQKLEVGAASMNKCKTLAELKKWAKLKKFNFDETWYVVTPKLDGITSVVDECYIVGKNQRAWTKGRDGYGLFIPEHFALVNAYGHEYLEGRRKFEMGEANLSHLWYTRGELIMKKTTFKEKKFLKADGTPFENPRNLVSGKFQDLDVNKEILPHIDFIRFDIYSKHKVSKASIMETLNEMNNVKLPYKLVRGKSITDEFLLETFKEFDAGEYEIDGLIIEINDADLREKLGYETSSENPCFARAFKGDFEDSAETVVTEIRRQISKQGYLKPVVIFEPIRLNGVTVTNSYADNERWLCAYGIGVGTKLKVKRSGMVIPRIIEVEGVKVLSRDDFNELCNTNWVPAYPEMMWKQLGITTIKYTGYVGAAGWNDSLIELVLDNPTDDVIIQRNIAFFEILKAEGISDGIITEFFEKGYTSIKKILELVRTQKYELESWDGWGEQRAANVINSIQKALSEATLPKLMHASGLFKNLGSKKLVLVTHFETKPTFEQLVKVDGFSDISANNYLEGYDKFWEFIADANIKINIVDNTSTIVSGDKLKDFVCVFTGFRDKAIEKLIEANGGAIGSSVSKKTTHLIMAAIGSGSTKEQKANELGIKIFDKVGFESFLKKTLGSQANNNTDEPALNW